MRKISGFIAIILILSVCFGFSGCKGKEKTTTYEIVCELTDNVLKGKEKVKVYNSFDNGIDCLKFNLYGNAFRKGAKYSPISSQYMASAYYNGENYGEMKIENVSSNGEKLSFEINGEDKNILTVSLKETLFPEESVSVEIEYELILAQVIARTGITKKTINLANFYPILCAYDRSSGFYECLYYSNGDPFYSECANYSVTFTCNNNYVVASSGKPTKSEENQNTRTTTYKIDNARSFAFVLSTQFEVLTKTVNGIEINYYYYKDEKPKESIGVVEKSIKLFEEMFGKYIYTTYSVVQTEFIQGGMEFSGLTFISESLEEKAYNEVIVHETAHQWWQTAVGNNEIEYGFLDEGLAEYSVVLFYERYEDFGVKKETLIESSEKTYKLFCSISDKLFGKVNTVMLRGLKDFNSEYEYVNIAYIKPCIMYEMLRKSLGDEKFFLGLKKYYENYTSKIASPDDLVVAMSSVGVDVKGFFDSFFQGKVVL